MKRFWKKALVFGTALAMVATLAACGGSGTEGQSEPADGGSEPVAADKLTNDGNYIFASGGTSGTYYPLAGAIANIENQVATDEGRVLNVTVQATGASKENVMLISQGEAELGIIQNDVLDYAYNGVGLFKENGKISGLATVCSMYPEVCQIVAAEDSGIQTVADLKGKRVSTGDSGSGVEANALQILAAYGLTTDDIKESHLSFKESGNAFKDSQIDAFFVTSGVPNTAITELSVTRKLHLLNVDGEAAEKLKADYPFYTDVVIPKDVYGTADDIKTLGVRALLVCRADMGEDEVYNFTKTLYSNLDTLAEAHAKGKEIKAEEAVLGVTVPVHPGAQKYYDEAGIK